MFEEPLPIVYNISGFVKIYNMEVSIWKNLVYF